MVSGWHARLLGSEGTGALRYLREERGLSLDTIECDAIGFDGVAITLLVNNKDGYLVNLRRRFYPTREPKIVGLAGRGSHLFPEVPEPGTSVLLVAGEFDALLAEQEGLPAVSTTTGASLPDHLVSHFSRCRVAVAYDVGEEAAAARTVEKLRRVVAEAWVVPLPMPNHGDDLTDWFVRDHRTARELLACIRRARRAVS